MELEEGFIICNASMKEKILKESKTIKNYIFLTQEELHKRLSFSLKPNAIFQLMKHYGFSYSLSQEYTNAVSKLEDKNYSNPKLDSIVSVLRYLKENQLIEEDPLFLFRLKQFPVTFIDPLPTKEYFSLKKLTEQYTKVYEVCPQDKSYTPIVYEFKTILEEALFVMNQIKELLRKGVSLNDIYIVHADEEYRFLLKRLSRSYGIPIEFDGYKNLLSASLIKQFLEACKTLPDFQSVLNQLDSKNILYPILVDILNENEVLNEIPLDCLEFLKAVLKNKKYPQKKYTEAVQFEGEAVLFDETDYVFFVGFNLGSAPKISKEEGFLNDTDLTLLNLSTSYEKNEIEYSRLKNWILSTPHLILTYKRYVKTESFSPSLLIEDMKLAVIKNPKLPFGYAKLEDELRLVGLYDLYLKYGQWHEDLEEYGIAEAKYKSYDHSYKPLPLETMQKHFELKPLRLAYSNVKLYFACPFSYYADRILGLNEFKPQMAARMGTFSHAVLEDSYSEDFNFLESVAKHKSENALESKDEFFFDQMTSVLRNILEFNHQHEQMSQLKTIEREAHIEVVKDTYTFEGYIDKLMYTIENDEVFAAIVDYKTGADIVSLDNIEDGFHLQLPSYMYLLSKYPPFAGLKLHILGLYLQKVNIVIFDHKSDVEAQMAKKFMLEGYSVASPKLISMLDPTYEKSTYIKSLGVGKDGFLRYSKVFLESQQEEITTMVEGLLDQASDSIHQGIFPIEPKKINGKNASCTFCKYKDICFYEYEDLKELAYKPFGKGGDEHGMD
ncbi:MAG: PD-(D/E)XK nuclease family protein [Anaeroplasmataceae bacterium]|nr:PD-(D/E)XK nuclease family protein [Anaeroplasmataceae bacterium]